MLKYYFRSVLVSWKIYKFGKVFWRFLVVEAFLRAFAAFTLFLDNIFFARYRTIKVKKPIFIVGHPRSGTTFLHQLLTSTDEAAAFKTWHLFFPALTARFLVKPMIDAQIRKGKTEVAPEWTGHKIDLDQTEEEEMLFFHNYDTQFITGGLLGLDDKEYPELHFHDQQPYAKRMKSMRFLNGCFQRHILYTQKPQIIAQTHFSTMRIKTMMEYYPDAKFIYIIRNPHQVVPSFFSLLYKAGDFYFDLKKVPQHILERYYRRRYQSMIDLYRYFYDLQKSGETPTNRVLVLPYSQLSNSLEDAFDKICDFTDLQASDELKTKVAEKAAGQKHYQRKHEVMDLAQFGVTHEMIDRDFAFIFEQYGHF